MYEKCTKNVRNTNYGRVLSRLFPRGLQFQTRITFKDKTKNRHTTRCMCNCVYKTTRQYQIFMHKHKSAGLYTYKGEARMFVNMFEPYARQIGSFKHLFTLAKPQRQNIYRQELIKINITKENVRKMYENVRKCTKNIRNTIYGRGLGRLFFRGL